MPFSGLEDSDTLPAGDIYVPLEEWLKNREALLTRNSRLGVLLNNTDDPAALVPDLDRLDLVVLEFPKMADGRAFSQARLLRERYGFTGDIRATGDVLHDQLFYMQRCGINAFELGEGEDLTSSLKAFDEMTITYQPAADEEFPIWRRDGK
ncbi:MAG: oxidoreductase [Sneathiella sp.]|nr:MAG: oxidoreductase [Sneathiella sp.]